MWVHKTKKNKPAKKETMNTWTWIRFCHINMPVTSNKLSNKKAFMNDRAEKDGLLRYWAKSGESGIPSALEIIYHVGDILPRPFEYHPEFQ